MTGCGSSDENEEDEKEEDIIEDESSEDVMDEGNTNEEEELSDSQEDDIYELTTEVEEEPPALPIVISPAISKLRLAPVSEFVTTNSDLVLIFFFLTSRVSIQTARSTLRKNK